ncbi:peptidoglycan/LPS O-acetylase OafA/YrhL [Pedobacter sp. UYP30]|uniref:acyltransferase family protein n=1 Tax=Pedobacter sp. UYP30 TaxID=1756400 RepID=UPI003397AD63
MKHRFGVLDIFRGLFASAVVFYHMSAFSDTPIINNDFIKNADMFVDFFFVLSGFVICYSYREIATASDWKTFLKKRIYRLYPLHLVMLLVFLLVEGIKLLLQNHVHINNSLDNSTTTFFTSLFLVNSVKFPGVHDIGWNMVSWSISAEWISYIVFSTVCFGLTSLKLGRWKVIPYFLVAIVSYFILLQFTKNTKLDYTWDYGFLRGLIGFFTGTVCLYFFDFSYHRLKEISKVLFTSLEAIVVGLIIYFVVNGTIYKEIGVVYELLFFISIFVFAFEKGYISQALNNVAVFKKMGKYSYSIYMTHTLLVSLFNVIFIRIFKLSPTAYWYLFAVNYLAVYFLSAWTYKNIEMRFSKVKSHHVIKKIE